MKLKPKEQARRIAELKADQNRFMYGRKKENGLTFKHPVKSAVLIAGAVMFLNPWQMATYAETGRLPKPRSEASFNQPVHVIIDPWKPAPNYVERRKANRVNLEPKRVQEFVDAAIRIDEIKYNPERNIVVPPPLERPVKKDDRWVRNEPKFIAKQKRLKHYVATGEWKHFSMDVPNVTKT